MTVKGTVIIDSELYEACVFSNQDTFETDVMINANDIEGDFLSELDDDAIQNEVCNRSYDVDNLDSMGIILHKQDLLNLLEKEALNIDDFGPWYNLIKTDFRPIKSSIVDQMKEKLLEEAANMYTLEELETLLH